MKTVSRSLLTSPLRSLALAFLFASSGPLARGQTTVWEGDNSQFWSDAENWSNGLPASSSDVFIGFPTLDVDATIGSLTLQENGDGLADDGGGRTLIVQGTTTLGDPNAGVEIYLTTGSNIQLGILVNSPAGILTGAFELQDLDGTATNAPTVIQFRDADVRENRAFVYLNGPDAAMLDQNTGENAFRNSAATMAGLFG